MIKFCHRLLVRTYLSIFSKFVWEFAGACTRGVGGRAVVAILDPKTNIQELIYNEKTALMLKLIVIFDRS